MTWQNLMQGEYDPPVQTRIVFGNRKTDSLREEIQKLGGKRALILSGRSVAEKTESVQRIADVLGEVSVAAYSGLTQRAPLAEAVEAANMATDAGVDTLIGVGGSTTSGQSTQELDTSTSGTSGGFKQIGISEDPDNQDTSADNCNAYVVFNTGEHIFKLTTGV